MALRLLCKLQLPRHRIILGSQSNGTKSIECCQAIAKTTIIDRMLPERTCFDRRTSRTPFIELTNVISCSVVIT